MKKPIAIAVALFAFVAAAQAQDTTPPTITMTAPVNGVEVTSDRVTVTGDATDDTGVMVVEYRIEGKRRWRRATLTSPGGLTTAYVFSFKNRKKGRAVRTYVRTFDAAKNESDTIGRKFRRSRSDTPVVAAAISGPAGPNFP